MTIEIIRDVLAWCSLINMSLLIFWLALFMLAYDWLYQLHIRWFRISMEQFDLIHYGMIGYFKISVLLFNIIPYIALRLVG